MTRSGLLASRWPSHAYVWTQLLAILLLGCSSFFGCSNAPPGTAESKSAGESDTDFSSVPAAPITIIHQRLEEIPEELPPGFRGDAKDVFAPQGMLVGEVTERTAVAQVRLAAADGWVDGDSPGQAGIVRFQLCDADGQPLGEAREATAAADHDFIARLYLDELQPNTRYRLKTEIRKPEGQPQDGPAATFRTLAGAEISHPASFVVVTGMNYARFHGDPARNRKPSGEQNKDESPESSAGSDMPRGYPALATILQLRPDFFVGTGDNVYYDTPSKGRAKTAPEMRRKWHEQFIQSRYVELFAEVPTYWEVDDHDYRVDDCDNTGDYAPAPELAQQILLEQLPMLASPDATRTYRTRRVSRELQIWLLEGRFHRSPNSMPDGPEKTIWGAAQREWLKETLQQSDAEFKLIISPTPLIGPDDRRKTDNHTNIGGFRHERDSFFAWLTEAGFDQQHLYFLCGDRHWQYHSIHPSGFEEFSCGALVDANSRLGRLPGDPQSTDPRGLIKQPYTQKPASGGFLHVSVNPEEDDQAPTLVFKYYDEQGELLHELTRSGPKPDAR